MIQQRVEQFWGENTLGAENGNPTLKAVVAQLNSEGYRVDQVVPLQFIKGGAGDGNLAYGIVLCTKS